MSRRWRMITSPSRRCGRSRVMLDTKAKMMKDRNCSAGIGDLKGLTGPRSRSETETPPRKAGFWVLAVVALASVVGATILMDVFIDVLVTYLSSTDPVRH